MGLSIFFSSWPQWDFTLFHFINQNHWTWGDYLFPILRFPKTWIPFYTFLFIYMAIKLKWKIWPWVLMAIVCITISDQLSSQVLKSYFARPRPCQEIQNAVILLVSHCPGNASFPSSHAVNHFAIGMYFLFSLKKYWKYWTFIFPLWAFSIGYAQVYVGVHYPMDVLMGSLLGIAIGSFVYLLSKFSFKNFPSA